MKQDLSTQGDNKMGKLLIKTGLFLLLLIPVATPSLARNNNNNSNDFNHLSRSCGNVRSLNDTWDWNGGDDSQRRPGAYSCLADKTDRDLLTKMNKIIRANYKIRDGRKALAQTVGLLNLTQKWPGVKCKDGKAGLECRYTDHRGRKKVEKFPALTADYANIHLNKVVTTPLEEKYKINNPLSKTPEERIADLERQLKEVESQSNMCGCSGSSGSSYADRSINNSSTSSGIFQPNTSRSPASATPPPSTSKTAKNYNKKGKGGNFYKVKGIK